MLDKKHIHYFEILVGKENVFSDKAYLFAYSYDATRTHFEPEAVIFPRDEADISTLLKYCNKHLIVTAPGGAGSRFTGGAFPANGGIILRLEKHMNKILETDMENMVAVVQPGVINMDLQKAVKIVVDMDGTLSKEHGIGMSKAPFMGIIFDYMEIQLFKDIKKSFDPSNILNPGKMGLNKLNKIF